MVQKLPNISTVCVECNNVTDDRQTTYGWIMP